MIKIEDLVDWDDDFFVIKNQPIQIYKSPLYEGWYVRNKNKLLMLHPEKKEWVRQIDIISFGDKNLYPSLLDALNMYNEVTYGKPGNSL